MMGACGIHAAAAAGKQVLHCLAQNVLQVLGVPTNSTGYHLRYTRTNHALPSNMKISLQNTLNR
jgi:hypothetical protein